MKIPKRGIEIVVYDDEFRVFYDVKENGVVVRKVRTFDKSVRGRLMLLAFVMGYLGVEKYVHRV